MDTAIAQRTPSSWEAALGTQYAVERELGRGGMATVYLARDLRHRRLVAIKVLAPELSAVLGPERFLQEIALTASLQHPHILPLFDSGAVDGRLYYVMPYVAGGSLRARLARERQLPVPEAVRLAREVADALAYAHARGVVHRDVKPENILLQEGAGPGDAHALVADFGIALAVQAAGGERMTRTGLSLGTPQYMAPEQAMGERGVDARADVYALGAVLYEMLAGEPPFTGPTAQAVVARAMTEAPRPLAAQRTTVPPPVEAAVRTALERLPADRFPTAAAFAVALTAPSTANAAVATTPAVATARWRHTAPLVAAGTLIAALAGAVGWSRGRATTVPAAGIGPVRFTIAPDSGTLRLTPPAISPDGRTVVYAAAGADGVHLYARRVDDVEARPLAGTEDAVRPFFSPDGLTVGFASGGALRAVRLDGVAASTITTLPADEMVLTVTWASDDAVYFTTTAGRLYRVPAGGGLPTRVPVRDARVRVFTAAALPGGRSLVLTQARAQDTATVEFSVLDLASKGVRVIGRGGVAARYGAGALVYAHWDGALYRRPFDLERLEFTGAPELIARGVRWDESPAFDVSRGGALVYGVGLPLTIANGRLTMTDRTGREERAFPARGPWTPRFSPDGRRLAYGARAPGHVESDVWITDLEAGTTQRVTTLGTDNNDPAWSPDGRTLAYSTYAGAGAKRLFTQALDASAPRPLGSQFSDDAWPSDWSADGALVVFTRSGPPGTRDLWVQPAAGGPARPYLDTPAQEAGARVSPDGRWVAYTSDETGRDEVYLQSFPQPGRKVLVSSGGGSNPVWRRDGRELYYWEQDLLIAVAMTPATPDVAPTPRARAPLFRAAYIRGVHPNYDVSPDGRHVALVQGRMRSDQLVVTLGGLQAPGPSGGPGPR